MFSSVIWIFGKCVQLPWVTSFQGIIVSTLLWKLSTYFFASDEKKIIYVLLLSWWRSAINFVSKLASIPRYFNSGHSVGPFLVKSYWRVCIFSATDFCFLSSYSVGKTSYHYCYYICSCHITQESRHSLWEQIIADLPTELKSNVSISIFYHRLNLILLKMCHFYFFLEIEVNNALIISTFFPQPQGWETRSQPRIRRSSK